MLFPWLCAVFGLIVGSFLNVVIVRRGKKTLGGRSECPHCHTQLHWYELVPVISFLAQKGVCRSCKKNISSQYILVELLSAGIFFISGVYLQYIITPIHPILSIIATCSFLTIVTYGILISVYDSKTKIVPTSWFIGMVVSSIVFLITYYSMIGFYFPSLLPHIIGIIICLPFLFLWIISDGRWMGFADIELIAWIGLYMGTVSGIMTVLSAFYIGAIFGILFLGNNIVFRKSYTSLRSVQIPFAPFLIGAWFFNVIFSWNLFSLITSLFM